MRAETKWAAWLTATLGSFAILEAVALRGNHREPGKPSGTLTHWMRGILGTRRDDKKARRWICGPGFVGFCVYLAGHMVAGWWNAS